MAEQVDDGSRRKDEGGSAPNASGAGTLEMEASLLSVDAGFTALRHSRKSTESK